MAIVVGVLGLVSTGWAGVVSGRILYEDKLYDFSPVDAGYVGTAPRPARFVEVELRRADNLSLLGAGSTDGEGEYAFAVQSAGALDVKLYILGRSSNSPWTIIEVRDQSARIQTVAAGPYLRDTNGAFVIDHTIPADSGGVRLGGIFNILDVILIGAEQVSAQLGTTAPPCVIYWEDGSTDGTYYDTRTKTIHLLGGTRASPDQGDDDSYDDPVILHEYGHYMAHLYSYTSSYAYGTHHILGYYNPALTWSEGWASAFQAFGRNSALYWDSLDGNAIGFNIDYERGAYNGIVRPEFRGMNNEGAVTCVLYDLFDDASSSDTSLGRDDEDFAFGVEPIWDVFQQDFASGALATFDDFYQGWRERFPGWGVDAAFAAFGMEFVPHEPKESVWSRTGVDRAIPDGDLSGASETLGVTLAPDEIVLPGGVRVWVAVQHLRPSDLAIGLRHPDGTRVALRNYGTSNGEDFQDVLEWYGYSYYDLPAESLSALEGKPAAGPWALEISDQRPGVSGTLRDWRLKLKSAPPSSWWQLY